MNVGWLICGRQVRPWGWELEMSLEKAPKSDMLVADVWSNEKAFVRNICIRCVKAMEMVLIWAQYIIWELRPKTGKSLAAFLLLCGGWGKPLCRH